MSKVKKIIGKAAPLAGLIPGIGLPAAVALGAGGGLLSGGGLRGALAGGLGAGALGGGGKLLGGALGLGADTLGSTVGTGLLGAGAGAASGGLKGALLGGAAGAVGGYGAAGGFDNVLGDLGISGPGSIFGTSYKEPLPWNGMSGQEGSGILGTVTKGASNISKALGVGTGGGPSPYGDSGGINLSSILGGGYDIYSTGKAKDELEKANNKALTYLNPYLASGNAANQNLSSRLSAGFDATQLADNPSYQFNLSEGQKALDRSAAAKGGYYSGAALKDAAGYTTNLANSYAKDYYNQWADTNNQIANQANTGFNAANQSADLTGTMGTASANATLRNASNLSQLLAGSGKMRRGYDSAGNPIWY